MLYTCEYVVYDIHDTAASINALCVSYNRGKSSVGMLCKSTSWLPSVSVMKDPVQAS
jgi:hypothetical protein